VLKLDFLKANNAARDAGIILCLVLMIFSVYWKTYENDFIKFFDDSFYITINENVNRGFSIESIKWAFHFLQKDDRYYWHPVTWLSHMADCQFFGLNAGIHHLVNVLFHAINAVLLFLLFRLMTGAVWRSAFLAMLFAIHPVNVDTVAWIAERKNLLSTTFWLLTMLAYLRYTKAPGSSRFVPVVIFFILGLLSKPMLITVPFALLLLDYWPLGRIRLSVEEQPRKKKDKQGITFYGSMKERGIDKVLIEKIPLFMLSFAMVCLTSTSLKNTGNTVNTTILPMTMRLQNAIVSYVTYVLKMIWPAGLSVYHPFPNSIPPAQVFVSLAILVIITASVIYFIKKTPFLFVGWFWYLGTLFPAIGLVQGGLWPAYAERWAYVPYIGLFLIISWGGHEILTRFRLGKVISAVTAISIFIIFSLLTFKQIGYWKDDRTLFSHNLEVDPYNAVAQHNLGLTYARDKEKKNIEKAIYHYQEALKIRPRLADVYFDMGMAYYNLDKMDDAIICLKKSIEINPCIYQNPHYNLGIIYYEKNDLNNAFYHFHEAIRNIPDNLDILNRIGIMFAKNGKIDDAMGCFQMMLQKDPQYKNLHNNMGNVFLLKNDNMNAVEEFRKEIRLYPKNTDAYINLGNAYMKAGNKDDAIRSYRQALAQDPSSKKAQMMLQAAMHNKEMFQANQSGKGNSAIDSLQKALEKDQSNAALHYELARMYQGAGNDDKAESEYKKAVSLKHDFHQALNNLARIYSARKDYGNSLKNLEKIIAINPDNPEGYYNIACVYSLQNDTGKSASWLKKAIGKGFNNWDLIRTDKDLENIRNSTSYKDILKLKP